MSKKKERFRQVAYKESQKNKPLDSFIDEEPEDLVRFEDEQKE